MDVRRIFVCGHRNPDCDSVMSAYALADLRRRTGLENVEPLCPGLLPARAKWVFDRYGLTPPASRGDVYVRVRDLIAADVPIIPSDVPLIDALRTLEVSGESSLPVAGADGRFCGMLSPAKLLALFIAKDDLSRPTGVAPLHACSQVLVASDRVHDVKAACIRNAHNHFPVVDEEGRLLGTVLKRAFAETPPFRMILVDHNETDQGIPGLEELPVIEVVDHHRISFTSPPEPIKYTADTVGSTCTIVARMFRGAVLRPSKEVAGVLLAGIVADTLFFQSPTTTDVDRTFAAWLEKICGVTAQETMDGLMSVASALSVLSPAKAIDSDRKSYAEGSWKFSLAQIEESNLALFHGQLDVLGRELERVLEQEKLDFVALLVTDPVRGNSELLYRGAESVRRALPWRTHERGTFLLPGVLSRKKQLLPEVVSTLAGFSR
ncbi:MAG: DHHA2 domain-containing protein [Kiritimatiellia bacterium]